MKLKVVSLILLHSFFSAFFFAQHVLLPSDNEYMQDFSHSTLKVCLIGIEKYDTALKKAVEENWTLTKYEFTDYKSIKSKNNFQDKAYSYLLPLSVVRWSGDPHCSLSWISESDMEVQNNNRWLCILVGGKKSLEKYREDNFAVYAPFDDVALEAKLSNASYRIGLMVKSMQDAINIVRDKQIKESNLNTLKVVLQETNHKAGILKNKTMLVNENLLKQKNGKGKFCITEDVLKKYKFKYKIVSQQEIETAIANKDKEYCYFCPAISFNKAFFIYNLENSEVVYGSFEWTGVNIKDGDINDLNKEITSY